MGRGIYTMTGGLSVHWDYMEGHEDSLEEIEQAWDWAIDCLHQACSDKFRIAADRYPRYAAPVDYSRLNGAGVAYLSRLYAICTHDEGQGDISVTVTTRDDIPDQLQGLARRNLPTVAASIFRKLHKALGGSLRQRDTAWTSKAYTP